MSKDPVEEKVNKLLLLIKEKINCTDNEILLLKEILKPFDDKQPLDEI